MHSLWSRFYSKRKLKKTLQDPLRREAFPMPDLLLQMPKKGCPQWAHEDSLRYGKHFVSLLALIKYILLNATHIDRYSPIQMRILRAELQIPPIFEGA